MGFVHLHNHTCYSLLDGANKIPELMAQAKALGMEAIAITDHGAMYGVIEFYKEAKKAGLKPIIGCEVYVAPRTLKDKAAGKDDSPYHLVLLAENQEGYQNLLKIVSVAWLEGFYYRPRVDKELLRKHRQGLIALSACLAGEIPSLLLQGQESAAREAAREYEDIFGRGNFFIELHDHGLAEQRQIMSALVAVARENGIPLVASNDVHYLRRSDASVQDILLCIQTGKTLQEPQRMRFETAEFYLKSEEEMRLLFGDYPEALANTVAIAERCCVEFSFGENHLPVYEVPRGYDSDTYLAELCHQGLKKRYAQVTKLQEERLEFELSTIKKMGYSSYFLIVWDFISFARKKGIFVGPGRGSAAGSIVAYCLRITDIDPLKYDLLFERFLNPERVSMPDIDIDFCFERRGEVIEYVVEKYGTDRVAQIITFGTLAARAAIRDTGRAMGVPLALVDKVAKLVPLEIGVTIARALEVEPQLAKLAAEDNTVAELLKAAKALEGIPRHAGTHAAGLVISQKPLNEYLPLTRTSEGLVSTQFDKDTVEEIGLLKMDLLGLRTLTVINNAVTLVEKNVRQIDLENIPLDDAETYRLFSNGDTVGVFQLESSGLRAILRELKPQVFEDIIALVALYRPGPLGSGMVEDFIKRRHGEIAIEYLHPLLEPILKPTYGVIIYQEQVMRIASDLAGFSLGEADLLRRAMGKKKPEIIAGLRQQFIEGAHQNGIEAAIAWKIFELMEYFAGYGFNKSHSAAYALLAYQTAYLKAHYPVEFMAALLTSVIESKDRVPFYIEECRQKKIEILPPDVNASTEEFATDDGHIRFGLAAIKQVGYQAIETILAERQKNGPFLSLQDFCERVDAGQVNRRVIENLIKAGAFKSLKGTRAQLLEILNVCIEQGIAWQRQQNSDQLSLFDFTNQKSDFNPPIPLGHPDDFTEREILQMEKETLGLFLSGHPLDEYKDSLKQITSHTIEEISACKDRDKVKLAGIVSALRRSITKRGESMAYFTLEDLTGNIETLVFPKKMALYHTFLENDLPVYVAGVLNLQEDKPKLFVDEMSPLAQRINAGLREKLYIKLPSANEEEVLNKLLCLVRQYPGDTPLLLYYKEKKKLIQSDPRYWVKTDSALFAGIEGLLGAGSYSMVKK